jgi:hypothetical protein
MTTNKKDKLLVTMLYIALAAIFVGGLFSEIF